MNAKNLIAAVSLLTAAGSVLADQTYPFVEHTNIASTKTRAEVVAETKPAVNTEFVEHKNIASTKTRAEVRHELAYQPVGGSEFVEHVNIASTRTREEVRNEAIQAAKGGQAKDTSSGS
ncbi:DUF4148 domain-containing protein [Noviherbaspirillum denitrificans]|uniref:DUF4148 domain-containing protein n=1 Tax=Noviherbaspirillum denitrificans TaxID=1968433 RepID=A0A254TJ64_9BURK|nr:DUF4148 domain-containing protein [Noviherbaspirillum denitrificans]OWW22671.1 hypothetical protein AYR66_27390 [Noviherbaspirillum denitrificans]